MKAYNISIDDNDILTSVYRFTANAAKQRMDARAVATEDDADLLGQFKDEGFKLLEVAFGRYYVGDAGYSIPDNCPISKEEIDSLVVKALVNYILAKWYELNGTGDNFIAVFNEILNSIKVLLSKRIK